MPNESGVSHALVRNPGRGGSVVASVVDSVATVRSTDPMALPPLHRTIDTDALVALVDSPRADENDVVIEFEYAGCLVTVDGAGLIHASDLESN